jgi:hypothetical protein
MILAAWIEAWYAERLMSFICFDIRESKKKRRLSLPKHSAIGKPLIVYFI